MNSRTARSGAADLELAYAACLRLARAHYENFPVASLALPRNLRRPVAVIYAFARTGDDLADEGTATAEQRLASLDALGSALDMALDGMPVQDPVILASAHVIRQHHLPAELFHALLAAFRMDVEKHRYGDFDQLLGYCRWSANPVGRLLLHLSRQDTEANLVRSDAVCTALQLINFLQDLDQDYREMDRIYLPLDEMHRFGVDEAHFRDRVTDHAMRGLFHFQVRRARSLLASGTSLGRDLPGRVGLEVRMITAGGLRVLDSLGRLNDDVFQRPRLGLHDRLAVLWQGLMPG